MRQPDNRRLVKQGTDVLYLKSHEMNRLKTDEKQVNLEM